MFDAISRLMEPLYTIVSWIMVQFHALFSALGLNPASGVTWALSIIGLVVVIRILLIPLFVKQIKAQRGLQVLQPEIKKIQEKYKGDRERQSQELMKLYKETGTNPLASCLPILAQAPIFFALFGVLNGIAQGLKRGVLTDELVTQADAARLFGANIFDTFLKSQTGAAKVVALVLIVLMAATSFYTQKQLMSKNMPASAMTGSFAQQQKILLYVFPLMFAVTGVNFPIGVLLYWLTTNLWSMGQQFYVIHRMPSPGSVAAENLERKRLEKARIAGVDTPAAAQAATVSVSGLPTQGQPTSRVGGRLRRLARSPARGALGGRAGRRTAPEQSAAQAKTDGGRAGATAMTKNKRSTSADRRSTPSGGLEGGSPADPSSENSAAGQRQQPKRQPRAKRR